MISKNSNLEHEICIIVRKNEIIFTDKNNVEFANLTVETMTKEENVPTSNFFVVFNTNEKYPLSDNIATVILDKTFSPLQ